MRRCLPCRPSERSRSPCRPRSSRVEGSTVCRCTWLRRRLQTIWARAQTRRSGTTTTNGHSRSAGRGLPLGWRPERGGSAEFANLDGVDVLLEGDSFAAVHGPHMDHLHYGRLSGALVLPLVAPDGHDGVTVGDELLGHRREVIADLPGSYEHSFEHRLRTDVRASEWKSVGLRPLDVVGHGDEGGGYVARCEARVCVLDYFLVGGHQVSSFLSAEVPLGHGNALVRIALPARRGNLGKASA